MYRSGGGGGEDEEDSIGWSRGGEGETEHALPANVGITAKGFGIGLGSCLSFALEEIQFVGRAEILKASGGVRDFVESLESWKNNNNNNKKKQRRQEIKLEQNEKQLN